MLNKRVLVFAFLSTLSTACTAFPPSPMMSDQSPGPLAESMSDKSGNQYHQNASRYMGVEIRAKRRNGHMEERFNKTFNGVKATVWTHASDLTPPYAYIGAGPERDPSAHDSIVEFKPVGSSRNLTAYFGDAYTTSDQVNRFKFDMKAGTWLPAALGGDIVVHDPTEAGFVFLRRRYVQHDGSGTSGMSVPWADAASFGFFECRRTDTKKLLSNSECGKYKPDMLVLFQVGQKWVDPLVASR